MKLSVILGNLSLAVAATINTRGSYQSYSKSSNSGTEVPQLAQTTKTQYVTLNGTEIAYRRFGKQSAVPLVYFYHFRASMDVTDPLLFNYIACQREVILFDNIGVGHSGGEIAKTLEGAAEVGVSLLNELGVTKADILGFSLGGGPAQYIAMEHPELVNKLILAGTQPTAGPGVVSGEASVYEVAEKQGQYEEEDMLFLFFSETETSREKGRAWWQRLGRQVEGEVQQGFVDGADIAVQRASSLAFASNATYFDRLQEIKVPVLVTNGREDIMIPTINSYILQQQLPYAHLYLYPDSGHGHLFQFPEHYASLVGDFLDNDL